MRKHRDRMTLALLTILASLMVIVAGALYLYWSISQLKKSPK